MQVGVAGDWHGNESFALRAVAASAGAGVNTVLHLGDLGVWPGWRGQRYLRRLEDQCARFDVRLLVTPGNHEDYDQLDALGTEALDGLGPVGWVGDHIVVLPRGHRFELGGRSFVSLGGAPSLDYEHRVPGREWWPQEAITDADVEQTVAGGHAEIMVAHDAPDAPWQTPAVAEIVSTNPFDWSQPALDYAAEGRARLTRAFQAVSPRLFLHGHFHLRGSASVELPDGSTTRIESLACDGVPGNAAVLDLATLEVTDLSV